MTDSCEADDQFWEDVLGRVDRFSRAWDSTTTPPDLESFLPATDADSRAVTLIELIKIDLEQRWQRGDNSASLTQYAKSFPELCEPSGIPVDLLYEELHIRQQCGDTVSLSDYVREFPDQATELRRLMNVEHPHESTSTRHAHLAIELEPGEKLGDFELLTELGKGAFARVFLARQQSMQRLVAVKISADRGREPQTLAQLDHPHIVRVYDQQQLDDRNLRLLYMQYLPGGTLQDVLARVQAFPPEQWSGQLFLEGLDAMLRERNVEPPGDSRQRSHLSGLDWSDTVCLLGRQLAEALHYAHQRGILHRDIKPANILMSESSSPQLVDFNISYCSKFEGASAGAYFGGSLAYMSPEQLDACNPRSEVVAEDLDARSDVYSLGVVLWEALTGARPFHDLPPNGNWSSTLDQLAENRRQGIATQKWDGLTGEASDAAMSTLQKCLQPVPANRFPSAGHLADQFQLAGNPATFALLSPPHTCFQKLVAAAPILTIVLAVVIPNAIASWLNYRFNLNTLQFNQPNALWHYQLAMAAINAIAFPIGVVIGIWMMHGTAKEVIQRLSAEPEHPATTRQRQRCLRLSRYLALIGICEWSIAGITFPIVMKLLNTPLTSTDALLYAPGLLAAGAWGAVLPFFVATTMLVEVWYPALLRPGTVSSKDVPAFQWVERKMLIYLLLPTGIPLISFFVLTLRKATNNPLQMVVLSVGGLLLFGLTYLLWRRNQHHLQLLQEISGSKSA